MELKCLFCGEEAIITVELNDGDTCRCSQCEEEFTVKHIREELKKLTESWDRLLAWLLLHPARKDEREGLKAV